MNQIPGTTADPASALASHVALLLCADQEVHDLVDSWLTNAGATVISISSAEDAEKQILNRHAALLVLDTLPIYLPGLPSLRKLKRETPGLRVMLIPPVGEPCDVGLARISGVDAILSRPTSRAILLSAVAGLCDSSS